jgi:hypothetical protein
MPNTFQSGPYRASEAFCERLPACLACCLLVFVEMSTADENCAFVAGENCTLHAFLR